MKVLHISRRFLPLIGGMERHIYDLSKALMPFGIESRVLTLRRDVFDKTGGRLSECETIDGIQVFRVESIGNYRKPIPLEIPVDLFRWADLVHVHDVRVFYETALLLKSFLNYKIVFSTHGFIFHTPTLLRLKRLVVALYYKPAFRIRIDRVLCSSVQDFETFSAWGVPNLVLAENGIDLSRFQSLPRQPRRGELLYFGRIDFNKGLEFLFRMLARLDGLKWRLNLVGGGHPSLRKELIVLAKDLGISDRVAWQGIVSDSELLSYLSHAHLVLLPSTYEGFGYTLLEAMAARCPCVANSIEPYKTLVEAEKSGFLVDFHDPRQAANQISAILRREPLELAHIEENARRVAERYDWSNKVGTIRDVYQNVDHD